MKKNKKLQIKRETLLKLETRGLLVVKGGIYTDACTQTADCNSLPGSCIPCLAD